MTNVEYERHLSEYKTMSEIAQELPGRPGVSSIHRWVTKGCKGVYLRHKRLGRRILLHPADVERFMGELAQLDEAERGEATNGAVREHEGAERKCERLGV